MVNKVKLCGLLGLATKAGKVKFGTDACIEAMSRGELKLMIIAVDASERTKIMFHKKCEESGIPYYEELLTEEIKKATGKQNKVILGIKDNNFSKAMGEIINGGEVIG